MYSVLTNSLVALKFCERELSIDQDSFHLRFLLSALKGREYADQFITLRSEATLSAFSPGLDSLLRYYSMMEELLDRVDFKSEVSLFSWKDAINPANIVSTNSFQVEVAAVMYNLGVLYCKNALLEPQTTFELFTLAAKKFAEVRLFVEHYNQVNFKLPCLSAQFLEFASLLMIAQGQECHIRDLANSLPTNLNHNDHDYLKYVAKSCVVYSDNEQIYSEIVSLCLSEQLKSMVSEETRTKFNLKRSISFCLAQHCLSEVNVSNSEFGQQVGRLKLACDRLSGALDNVRELQFQHEELIPNVSKLLNKLQDDHHRALVDARRIAVPLYVQEFKRILRQRIIEVPSEYVFPSRSSNDHNGSGEENHNNMLDNNVSPQDGPEDVENAAHVSVNNSSKVEQVQHKSLKHTVIWTSVSVLILSVLFFRLASIL
ncbi:hypothetical protein RCL1_007043 [Eukaryota sp. TZLM3-RCL]